MCKLHGVRLIKGLKFLKVCFNQNISFENHVNENVS